jgi:hypothetical protein
MNRDAILQQYLDTVESPAWPVLAVERIAGCHGGRHASVGPGSRQLYPRAALRRGWQGDRN